MAQVGLRNVHYAVMTKDDATGVTYNTIKAIPGVITAKIQPKSNSATLFADDGPAETATTLGEIDVEFEFSDLPVDVQADWLGHTVDATTGVLVKKSTDVAPYIALGFVSRKSSGKDLYVWLLKGKAQVPEDNYKTMEDKPDFGTKTISLTFVRRNYDNAYQAVGDEDNEAFTGGAQWFNKVWGDTTGS
jgi:phi13 family phage major tail protein